MMLCYNKTSTFWNKATFDRNLRNNAETLYTPYIGSAIMCVNECISIIEHFWRSLVTTPVCRLVWSSTGQTHLHVPCHSLHISQQVSRKFIRHSIDKHWNSLVEHNVSDYFSTMLKLQLIYSICLDLTSVFLNFAFNVFILA